MKILAVADVLERLGVTRACLYYWEETRKIPRARRTSTGRRYFLSSDLPAIEEFARNNQARRQALEGLRRAYTLRKSAQDLRIQKSAEKI